MRIVGLIPARDGSKRLPDKNALLLNGHPLLAYSIVSALKSAVFTGVFVSTNSLHYEKIARHYGAEVILRPDNLAQDQSRDIEWVRHAVDYLDRANQEFDAFAILRPTSPLRTTTTICRAVTQFLSSPDFDSLRAVELCQQHPGKMWTLRNDLLVPVLPVQPSGTEWYSQPTQALPEVWVQNASLEIAWKKCVLEANSISGAKIQGFKTIYPEGFDINTENDLRELHTLLETNPSFLPSINIQSYMAGD